MRCWRLARPAGEPREAARTFNGIIIAYGVGALVVLFAFGWFMVDRWRVLGDSGVFGLAVAYAAVFLMVAHVLQREGFDTARGVAVLLAVAMAPLAMRALLRWIGVWTPQLAEMCCHAGATVRGVPGGAAGHRAGRRGGGAHRPAEAAVPAADDPHRGGLRDVARADDA